MYIRAQSPESSNCCGSLASLAPLISSHSPRPHDGGGDKSPSPPSPLYSSVSSAALVGNPPGGTNFSNFFTRRDDVSAPLHRVEGEYFLPRVESECRSILASNCSSENSIYDQSIEDEDRTVNFVSPCKSALDVEGCAELAQTCSSSLHQQQQADSTSVLQHKWSTSSSTDSLKSINQYDENEEGRDTDKFDKKSSALSEGALFYRSYGAHQQQQPSIGLHRKWSDSSCSLDSIDQEEEEKNTPGFPGSHQNNHADKHNNNSHHNNGNGTVGFKGLSGSLHKKWSSSNCSLDSIDDEEEEDDYEIRSQFPPLIECVRVTDPPPMLHGRNGKEGPVLSSSSSSIGNRSEDSSGSVVSDVDSPGDMEVESTLRSGHHSQLNLSILESSLPIKRGLSRFWNGKAKSFASLQDVSSLATLADLAKPENPYNKRRRFSSGFGIRPSSPLSRPHTAGISKKPPSGTGKSCLAIAVAMGNKLENGPKCLSPQSALRNAQRSFSLSDLEQHGSHSAADHAPPATMTRMRRS